MKIYKLEEIEGLVADVIKTAKQSKYQYCQRDYLVSVETAKQLEMIGWQFRMGFYDKTLPENKSQFELQVLWTIRISYDARSELLHRDIEYCNGYIHIVDDLWLRLLTSLKTKKSTFVIECDHLDYNRLLPYNWKDTHKEPNQVGVLTNKKVGDWVCYLTEKRNAALQQKDAYEQEYNNFMERIRSIDLTNAVSYNIGETSGYIETKYLKFSYNADKKGYQRATVMVKPLNTDESIDAFRELIG